MQKASRDLLDLLQRLEAGCGERTFLGVGGDQCSGRAFAARVRATAAGLRRHGMAPGDRLAVHLHRCVDEAVALLAAAIAGGIAVPIHSRLKDAQVAHVLADCAPWAVVTSATKGALLQDPAAVFAGQRLFAVGAAPRGVAAEPFAALEGAAATPPAPLPVPAPTSPAILLYTSGSTGLAKAVVQDHHNLALGAAIVSDYLGLGGDDHILGLLPFSFDYGLNQLLSAMHVGCRITAADFLGPGELRELLQNVRPTGLAGVPSLWHEVARALQSGALTAADGQSLRYITSSGGKLAVPDVQTLRRGWPQVTVFSMYGLTEAFRSAFLEPLAIDARPDSFGKALPGVELLLVDPQTGAVLHGEATGELVHTGALVARGYWQRPEATAARFRRDPRGGPGLAVWSGDLVRRDADGFHYFVGRLDRLMKVQGHRISPDEVAQAVVGMPGVGEVAVLGLPGGEHGHRIVLCLAGDAGDAELPARVLRQCRARLPAYMWPAAVRVLPALPHNQNGKIDVNALVAGEGECTGGS